ncbi:transcriptional regulator, MarR family [Stigmatella aurantiaca]|uniref:Transcriptional regulator, MarR family n=1 Tax=Stigmatella aurantiaca TaxID=41 RepID=A0A1H7KV36_STIAU|nr:MarR family transcriptional regulator [Stigmatella aurantiaca]SEK90612.1 transcriptional regulator, MarR family [Stigmatella aurantiaca]
MTAAKDPLLLEQQLCFALYRASRAMIRAYGPLLEPLGVTYPQYLVLLALWEEEGIPVKRLGEQLVLDSATLTPLLKRLEQRGIVERRRDGQDERVVRIFLTEGGRALRAQAKHIPGQLACRAGVDAASSRSMAQLARLREELTALSKVLEEGEADTEA